MTEGLSEVTVGQIVYIDGQEWVVAEIGDASTLPPYCDGFRVERVAMPSVWAWVIPCALHGADLIEDDEKEHGVRVVASAERIPVCIYGQVVT